MSSSVRQLAERDLAVTLTGDDYGVPVKIIGPDGLDYSTDTLGQPVRGRLVYDHAEVNELGLTVVIENPCLTLRVSTLRRVPVAGERWEFKVPLAITDFTGLVSLFLDNDRPPVGGRSLGIRRYNLIAGTQASA